MRPIILMFLFVSVLILPSCRSKTDPQMPGLNVNFQVGDLSSLSPHHLTDMRGRVLGKLIYEGLTRIDSAGIPQLAGAEKVEISQDGRQYTFALRKQFWSDGSEVNASHYVNAWRHALSSASDSPRADLFYLIHNGQKAKKGEISIEEVGLYVLDERTLVVQLEHPSSHFLHLLAQPLFAPNKNPAEEPKLYNGPFILAQWDKERGMRLEPNPHFWNRDDVKLPQITINFVTDPMTAFYMFEKNQIDWIGDPISPIAKEISNQLIEKKLALSRPVDRFYWVYLNLNVPYLQSAKIRKALYLTINREQIAHHIFHQAEPIWTPVHESMIPYQPQLETLAEARQLLKEGLSELNLDDPLTLKFNYAQYANMKILAEYLKNQWEETLGVDIHLEMNEWNVLRHKLESGNFELAGCYEAALYGDPIELLERFEELGSGNYSQWHNPSFKEKMKHVKQEGDGDKQVERLVEAEALLIEETPLIPVFRSTHIYAHHPALKGYVFDASGCVDFAYSEFVSR